MLTRTIATTLVLIVCLVGCSSAPKSVSWKARDLAISPLSVFDVQPVLNAAEQFIKPEIPVMLHANLKQQLESKRLRLADPGVAEKDVLLVTTEILGLRIHRVKKLAPYTDYRTTHLVLRTRLSAPASGETVAEIITIDEMEVGKGLFTPKDPYVILRKSAESVVREIIKLM